MFVSYFKYVIIFIWTNIIDIINVRPYKLKTIKPGNSSQCLYLQVHHKHEGISQACHIYRPLVRQTVKIKKANATPRRTCCPGSPTEPRKLKTRVTMKTSQSNASGKAGHPVSLKFLFNLFTNGSRESEGSLSTWDFGSSGNDGCFPVTQKGSPKKYFLGWGIATAEYFLSFWRTGTFSPVFSPTVYSMLTVRHTFPGFILKTSNIMLHIQAYWM